MKYKHRQTVISVLFYQQVHVTSPSNVADHCVLFALSDSSDADYQQQCSHQHTDLCDRCQSLQETLAKIERVLGETTFPTQDAKDEALFIFQTAQLAIMSWKCHILRSANQDQARIDALEKLDDNTVLIINDWAINRLVWLARHLLARFCRLPSCKRLKPLSPLVPL